MSSNAAIYARVSSARQKQDETIGSQTAALRAHAERLGLDVPEQWVFCDEGFSGASLVRPELERLRDLVCQVPIDVLLVYSPDRLARKYAYQALLIEELAKAGTTVTFVKGPHGDSPEDALLTQFQGMIAEYERAQILERTRRGKTHRAKAGSINVLGGAPFGYRYVRKSEHADARYEIVTHEAAIVTELFTRYAEGGTAIAELARWLTDLAVPTRTGKARWDRSVIWGMLRNPAYAGQACFGKTRRVEQTAGLNRTARLAGRTTPRHYTVADQDQEDWIGIPVPALVDQDTWQRAQRRLADNKRYAARNSTNPSLLQGICVCANCGYAYYRTSTRTASKKKIYYYRCLGSDGYRYEHGRVCASKPVRADQLDQVVWDHVTGLLADPALIHAEIDRRLSQQRGADPATAQRKRIDAALATTSAAITRLISAYQEQLITLDELRARMPDLRTREANLRHQRDTIEDQIADREVYLRLADNLEQFLTGLHDKAATATIPERQRVLRLLVKDVLVSPDKITIRHSIPVHQHSKETPNDSASNDSEGEPRPGCQLRWRSHDPALRGALAGCGRKTEFVKNSGLEERADQRHGLLVLDPCPHQSQEGRVVDVVETPFDVCVQHPPVPTGGVVMDLGDRVVGSPLGPEPVRDRHEVGLEDRLQHHPERLLHHPVGHGRDPQRTRLAARLGNQYPPHRRRSIRSIPQARGDPRKEHPDLAPLADLAHGDAIDPSGAGPFVACHVLPGHQQEVRV
jgi:site-specific DNA recombinase